MNISDDKISEAIVHSIESNLFSPDDDSTIFYDLELLRSKIDEVNSAFPPDTLNTVAIKACPLLKILGQINKLGFGAEAASLPEIYIAQKTGFPSHKIIFDSPAKTISDLEYALRAGICINADSFEELVRIDALLRKIDSKSTIGIRLNPQVGTGSIASSSTAGEYSKFGIPVVEFRGRLIESFIKYPWLSGVHTHIGSQGCSLDMLLDGAEVLKNFVNDVNIALAKENPKRNISTIDIGGGLPVRYKPEDNLIPVSDYAGGLQKIFKNLKNSDYELMTEFGRYIFANSGFAATRVEYVKASSKINTAIIHVGADLLLRKCYCPEDWYHEISILDSFGKPKEEKNKQKYNIAGPLCFSGDMLASNLELPEIETGDLIIIHDIGAYTLSMWSRYNSRQMPKVIGFDTSANKFEIIKERENLDNLFEFWS